MELILCTYQIVIGFGLVVQKKMIHLKKVRNFYFVSLVFFHICLDDVVNPFPNKIDYVIYGWFLKKRDLAIYDFRINFLVLVHSGLALPPKPHSDRNLIHTPIIIIRVVKTHLDGQSNGTVGGIYKWRYAGFEKYLRLLHGCFSSILLLQWVLLTDFFSFLFLHKHV